MQKSYQELVSRFQQVSAFYMVSTSSLYTSSLFLDIKVIDRKSLTDNLNPICFILFDFFLFL